MFSFSKNRLVLFSILSLCCLIACLFYTKLSRHQPVVNTDREIVKRDSLKMIPVLDAELNQSTRSQKKPISRNTAKCFFKGTVVHQFGPSTFNTIWVQGLDEHNRGVILKSQTDGSGDFLIHVQPGNYKIQVYGPQDVVRTEQMNLDCSRMILPTIQYKK